MSRCQYTGTPAVELYFYGDLDPASGAAIERHLLGCPECRAALDDLRTIRAALSSPRVTIEAPPAGDWSGFMRRLDQACGLAAQGRPARPRWSGRALVACAAAILAVVTGLFMAGRPSSAPSRAAVVGTAVQSSPIIRVAAAPRPAAARALREASAEHLDRSKLVVLDLAARDPRRTHSADWKQERELAGALLSDTRLYRFEAQDQGLGDVARVMRDLETVLLEASMSGNGDRASLERVQHLIERRDLVGKMQVVSAAGATEY